MPRRPRRRRGRREGDGRRRDPHRLHPVRRDHGDRAQRGGRRAFCAAAIILAVVAVVITVAVYGVVAAHREDGRHRPEPDPALLPVRQEGRPRPGRRHAQAAGRAVGHRHRGDAVGGRTHPARRDRRAGLARALRPGPPRRAGRHHAPGVGGVLAWLVNTAASAVVGLVVGAVVVAVMHVLPFGRKDTHARPPHPTRAAGRAQTACRIPPFGPRAGSAVAMG